MFGITFLAMVSFFTLNAQAAQNFITTGFIYEGETSSSTKSILFNPVESSESKFELVGLSVGLLSLTDNGIGFNGSLDISQLAQGIGHTSDSFTKINAAGNINYFVNGWLYPFAGFHGTLLYYKMGSDTWNQVFGGMGWQVGVGFKYKNILLEIYQHETSDHIIDIFGNGGVTLSGFGARALYAWSF